MIKQLLGFCIFFYPLAILLIPNCAICSSCVSCDTLDPQRGLILYSFSVSLQFEFYMMQKWKTRQKVVYTYWIQILYKIYSRDGEYKTYFSNTKLEWSRIGFSPLTTLSLGLSWTENNCSVSHDGFVWLIQLQSITLVSTFQQVFTGENECFLICLLDHLGIPCCVGYSGKARVKYLISLYVLCGVMVSISHSHHIENSYRNHNTPL